MAFGYITHFTERFLQLVNTAFVLAVLHEVHERLHTSGETFGAAGYLHTRSFHLWFGN